MSRSNIPRMDRLLKVLSRIFRDNPNTLFHTRNIRSITKDYTESELYSALRFLVKELFINCSVLQHKKYYWLRRRE